MNLQRVAIIILVVFVALYVALDVMGGVRHQGEAPTGAPTPTPTPVAVGFDAWNLTPPFLKLKGLAPAYAPGTGGSLPILVPSANTQYRLARFRAQGPLTINHARFDDAGSTGDEKLKDGDAVTIVLPSAPSTITIACRPFQSCVATTL